MIRQRLYSTGPSVGSPADSSGVGSWNPEPQASPVPAGYGHHVQSVHQLGLHEDQHHRPDSNLSPLKQTKSGHRFTPEQQSDDDTNMILINRSTPTPTKTHSGMKSPPSKVASPDQDEPQDLTVPKIHFEPLPVPAKTVNESEMQDETESSRRPDGADVRRPPHCPSSLPTTLPDKPDFKISEVPIKFPLLVSQFPYYLAPGLVQHPYVAASLPTDFSAVHFPRTPPDIAPIGAAAPGHTDSKLHRHLHRSVPYHKVCYLFNI